MPQYRDLYCGILDVRSERNIRKVNRGLSINHFCKVLVQSSRCFPTNFLFFLSFQSITDYFALLRPNQVLDCHQMRVFDKGTSTDHFCKVSLQLTQWLLRLHCEQFTDDGRKVLITAHWVRKKKDRIPRRYRYHHASKEQCE